MNSMESNSEEYEVAEGIVVNIPFGEKRLETLHLIAQTMNEVAKALNQAPAVSITGCHIEGAKTGIKLVS